MNAGICSEIFTAYNTNSYINHVLREFKDQSGISNSGNNCIEHSDSDDDDEGSLASFIEYDSDSSQGKCKCGVFPQGTMTLSYRTTPITHPSFVLLNQSRRI